MTALVFRERVQQFGSPTYGINLSLMEMSPAARTSSTHSSIMSDKLSSKCVSGPGICSSRLSPAVPVSNYSTEFRTAITCHGRSVLAFVSREQPAHQISPASCHAQANLGSQISVAPRVSTANCLRLGLRVTVSKKAYGFRDCSHPRNANRQPNTCPDIE